MIITRDELIGLTKILDDAGQIFFKTNFDQALAQRHPTTDLRHFYPFYNPRLLATSTLQNSFWEYLMEHKQENLAKLYEDKLDEHIYQSKFLIPYSNFIKDGKYYPEEHQIIYNILDKQLCDSNKIFKTMSILASLCKDDLISAKCFALLITSKKQPKEFLLLQQEQFQKIWKKRFKGIDIESIAPAESSIVNKFFQNILNSKGKEFFTREDGHIQTLVIDADIISQKNKLPTSKYMDALRIFITAFTKYAKECEELLKTFSIYQFENKTEKSVKDFTIEIRYNDISQKDRIYSLMCDLIDYALSVEANKSLKGAEINKNKDTNKFFGAFILNYTLQTSIPKKDDVTVKKYKV